MENNSSEKYEINAKDFDYKLAINDSYEINEDKFVSLEKINREKNKLELPFIFYIFIFSSILFIGALIALLIIFSNKKPDYDIYDDPYIKPSISDHIYSKIIFHNGLEIILTQVNYNDSAGGAISFEKGYLNEQYDPGYLKLVFYSFTGNEKNSNRYLKYYMGDSEKATEEFYSTVYFKILNSGFQKFLANFTKQVNNEVNENNVTNITNFIKRAPILNDSFNPPLNILNEKEKHLIEYLVYGIAYENGSDIWRQCINFNEFDVNKTNTTQIKKIVKDLFIPKKVKMMFHSRYKISLMRKIAIKNVKPLSNLPGTDDAEIKENFTKFSTNKIIYHQIDKNEDHYIKINYYVNGSNNLSELYKDSGYFNYIKYILDETNNESLYYKLTHPENDDIELNIKSLSCDFEVVLKSKIRFTILIELNIYSYDYLKEIIEIVYNYMEKIKKHIDNLDSNDERVDELNKINDLNFTFTEDVHEMEYFKNKAKDLFYRDDKDYYLKEVWIPPDLKQNNSKIKSYSDQLTIENSVIFLSISKDIVDEYLRNKSWSFIFSDLKNTTGFSNIVYSIHDIEELNLNIVNRDDVYKLNYYPNEFISNFDKNTKIPNNEEDKTGNYTSLNTSDKVSQFYWQKHTKFGVPKVFVNLYFFHPFLRPNSTDQNMQDNIFFYEMLYISYLKRELYFNLGDAIRAGASLEIGFNENFFFIDAFYYSDKIKEILKIIHEKIISQKSSIIDDNLKLYKDYALNDLLKLERVDIKNVLRYEFYKGLTEEQDDIPPVYNYYKFNKTNFENFTKPDIYLKYINAPIVRGFILGYCEKEEAEDIYNNIFKLGFNEDSLQNPLMYAYYSNTDYPPELFIIKCLDRSKLKKNITDNNIIGLKERMFSFMNFAKYTYENRIVVELFKKIGQHNNNRGRKYVIESVHQKDIALRFNIAKKYYENTAQFQLNILKSIDEYEEYYTKERLDVVGDYFYYIVTNLEIEYSKTPNNIRNCAFSYSYEELYGLNNNDENEPSYKIDRNNYKNFTDTIKIIFKQYPNYYQFSNDNMDENNNDNIG